SGAGAGGSTAPGCCAGCGCSALCFMGFRFTKQSLCRPRRAVVTGNSLSHTKLAARTARVNSPAHPRSARDVAVDERYAVSQRLLALRVVEDLVVHLRIPPHLDRTAQPVGERAGQVRVHHAVLAREQEQQGRLDAVAVGRHGALGPLDLAPRARRHHVMTPGAWREIQWAQRAVAADGDRIESPLLFLLAGEDRVVDAHLARAFADGLRSPVQVRWYPEMYHEILHDPEREQALGDSVAFVDGHIAGAARVRG